MGYGILHGHVGVGAADDGAQAAVMLELSRVLLLPQHSTQLSTPIILLWTAGEEPISPVRETITWIVHPVLPCDLQHHACDLFAKEPDFP